MSIKKFFNFILREDSNAEKKYAGSCRRSFAAMIDATVVLFLRAITAQTLGTLFVEDALQKFFVEFREKFGTEFVKNNSDHIDFVLHHQIFITVLLFCSAIIFVGALYHALLNSSAWQGTIGKRLMKIVIEKEDDSRINFSVGLAHYFLSILPFLFILYLIAFKLNTGVIFFKAVTASNLNIFLGILFLLWTHIHTFTKRKTTAYDLICKTVLVNKKTSAKFPWSKEKISNFL